MNRNIDIGYMERYRTHITRNCKKIEPQFIIPYVSEAASRIYLKSNGTVCDYFGTRSPPRAQTAASLNLRNVIQSIQI